MEYITTCKLVARILFLITILLFEESKSIHSRCYRPLCYICFLLYLFTACSMLRKLPLAIRDFETIFVFAAACTCVL